MTFKVTPMPFMPTIVQMQCDRCGTSVSVTHYRDHIKPDRCPKCGAKGIASV